MKIELINKPDFFGSSELSAASARTCYSQDLIHPIEVDKSKHASLRKAINNATREAGHLTTRQHAHYTFGITGVSRGVVWSTLHAHPFYNTEQQSQRYVKMKNGIDDFICYLPDGRSKRDYQGILEMSLKAYDKLVKSLYPSMKKKYYRQFPARKKNHDKYKLAIRRLCMEEARYSLPLATPTNLYHTVSSLTLMRLAKMATYSDFPTESKELIEKMINLIALSDNRWVEESGDITISEEFSPIVLSNDINQNMFDTIIKGFNSKLCKVSDYSPFPEMFVNGFNTLTSPQLNPLISDPLNLYSSSREMDLLATTQFTFLKKLSLTAHAQQQRHRSLRDYYPFLNQINIEQEWITPKAISECNKSNDLYQEHMEKYMFEVIDFLRLSYEYPHTNIMRQHAYYLLPNSYPVRVIESGDFLSYFHLWKQRLCVLAQNEIWQCSKEEVEQVIQSAKVSQQLKNMLGAPCHLRKAAGIKPYCPEGKRFCGEKVWEQPVLKLDRSF